MSPEEHLSAGDVAGALSALQEAVRGNPADSGLRIFLFQLLCVLGQWPRAATQLKVAAEMDPEAIPMKHTYSDAILCEALRAEVFSGMRSPLVFGDPEAWIANLIQAVGRFADNDISGFEELHDQAFDAAPAISGTINGDPFEWICDADDRLGPVLEVILEGKYYWVPFHRLQKVVFEPPEDLRDVVWMPAYLTWANGGEAVGLVPTRYPQTQEREDAPELLLARATHWDQPAEGLNIGWGQKLLATDQNDYAIMDCRELTLNSSAE